MYRPQCLEHDYVDVLCVFLARVGGRGLSKRWRLGGAHRRARQKQSALREGLLDLIQHIPKQRWLVTFSVDGHRLISSFDQQTDVVTLD